VPHLHDVATMLKLLGQTGLKVTQDDDKVTLNGAPSTAWKRRMSW
jgi:UDP-N-acetylglucosamine 1-carboxyvinyltransferase